MSTELSKAYIGFKKLAAKKGPKLAAFIGRKKYGVKKFASYAKKGKKMRHAKPVHAHNKSMDKMDIAKSLVREEIQKSFNAFKKAPHNKVAQKNFDRAVNHLSEIQGKFGGSDNPRHKAAITHAHNKVVEAHMPLHPHIPTIAERVNHIHTEYKVPNPHAAPKMESTKSLILERVKAKLLKSK